MATVTDKYALLKQRDAEKLTSPIADNGGITACPPTMEEQAGYAVGILMDCLDQVRWLTAPLKPEDDRAPSPNMPEGLGNRLVIIRGAADELQGKLMQLRERIGTL